jgi:asparagine synthase (glutamine-hydrolysing)
MCGICGKLYFKERTPTRESIRAMCKTLVHRGPDNESIQTAPHIGMGQRRLAVIDLTPDACPPLTNEDRTIWLVFNGEIYNFRELRKILESKGHLFKTNSDSEVIIHQYEEDGKACLKKLRGMFALAIWDQQRKILFCARDRMGKKPFCYTRTPHSFVFGSEIKAITNDPDVPVAPNYHAIDQYLTYQFVPSPMTAFEDIKRLRPGEYLTCDLSGNVKTQSYWEPYPASKANAPQEELASELKKKLQAAVKLRMVADVPLGAFLSGGIDSAIIVALMSQESSQPVKTFSIGLEDDSTNELPYARLVANLYRTEHHELIVKPDSTETLPLLVQHYNEPFADSSALPTFLLSQMTREFVTVAMSGDGGDESFAGYDHYARLMSWHRYDILPAPLKRMVSEGGRKILKPYPYNNYIARIRRGMTMIGAPNIKSRRLQYGAVLKPEEKRMAYTSLFNDFISQPPVPTDPLEDFNWTDGMDALDWLMRFDQRFYLPDCLMVKTDIASMANGLEVRCPFLDHKLVEFAATIPSQLKINALGQKAILKQAFWDMVPIEILKKPKTGFSIPIAKWLRKDLSELLKGTLLDGISARRGLFKQKLLVKMVNEHINGRRDWSNRLWAFLFLELWFREFID